MSWARSVRGVGAFVGNFLAAAFGTAVFTSEWSYVFRVHSAAEALRKEYVISAVFALALGYFVTWKWRLASARWIWTAGALLFGAAAIAFWRQHVSVVTGEPTLLAVAQRIIGPSYLMRETIFAIILMRTLFYSMGAWLCSAFPPSRVRAVFVAASTGH